MSKPLVELYLASLQAGGVSPHTVRWHQGALKRFTGWVAEYGHPENPEKWTAPLVRAYIVFLQGLPGRKGKPFSPHPVQSYTRSLRAFCQWLFEEEFIPSNPMAKVKQPKAPALVKPTLTREEIAVLLDAAKAGRTMLRDTALVLFMIDTGTRANEVCTLKAGDIVWESRLAKVYGKGQKERLVSFRPQTAKAMQKYGLKGRNADCPCFLQSEEGEALTTSGLFLFCRRLGNRAGVALNPHMFRHTFCTESLRSGASVFTVQRIMGHTTLDVTMRYAALVAADLAADHAKHSPVAGLVGRNQNGKR